jgi:hypothetical protein
VKDTSPIKPPRAQARCLVQCLTPVSDRVLGVLRLLIPQELRKETQQKVIQDFKQRGHEGLSDRKLYLVSPILDQRIVHG